MLVLRIPIGIFNYYCKNSRNIRNEFTCEATQRPSLGFIFVNNDRNWKNLNQLKFFFDDGGVWQGAGGRCILLALGYSDDLLEQAEQGLKMCIN